jgi:hypothetical protein
MKLEMQPPRYTIFRDERFRLSMAGMGASQPAMMTAGCPLWMAPALQVQFDVLAFFGRVQSSVRPVNAVDRDCWP